jgi:hypothetical protein
MMETTDQQRNEFRELLSEIIATLHDAQELAQSVPTPYYTDEQGERYADPKISSQKARINSTVKMLDELRGNADREWLHAYIERRRMSQPAPTSFVLVLDGKNQTATVNTRSGAVLVRFDTLDLTDGHFKMIAEQQCPDHAPAIIRFFHSHGIANVRLVKK